MRHLIALLAAPMLLSASLASAQETGSLSGTVLDVTGRPVVGATVRITGEAMPAERTMATSDKGTFGFLLLPGEYVVDVEKTGVGKVSRRLVVEVARETRTDIVLGAIAAEPVSVTALAQPDIDLKSTEVTFNYRRSVTQDLPLDRSYLGYLQLIPGVAEHQGFTPNGGASQRDNAFLVDSVHISNPFFGYLSTEINELDIAEFDVKRGALRPEFGRSTGFITNAVIKSGGNSFAGAYRFEAIPSSLIAESAKVVHSSTDRWTNAFGFGGPVVKSRLFFYASASILRSGTPGAANLFGPLPNRKEATNESFGKVTTHLGLHVIAAGVRNRPTTVDFAGIGVQDSPDVATNIRTTNRVANASYDWFVGNRTTVSVRYVHLIERTETTAVRDLGFLPPFEEDNVSALGHVVVGGIGFGAAALKLNRQDYSADELKANVSRHFDMNGATHQLKIGFGWNEGREDLTRRSNGWGDISYVIYGDQLRVRASTYPEQPSQHSTGRTYTLFAQDDISIGSRIAINAGVLTNRDDFEQTASGAAASSFPTFGFFDELQPRVGLTVQLRKRQGDKAYVNWGRYYGLDQISSARAVSGGRLYTIDTDFDSTTAAIVAQVVAPNTGVKSVAANLDPPRTDEFVAGYATPLGGPWTFDAFFLSRRSSHFIEDVPTVLPFSNFQFQNDPYAARTYRTLTLSLRRRLQDQWSLDASYAWSRLAGNYDLDYTGDFTGMPVFSTSSLFDDGPGAFSSDRYRNGVLSQDRTHVYKVLGTWSPKPIDRLSLGVFVRGQSGTPWEARGLPWNSGLTYLRFLEPAGSHRNPFWTNVDALAKYSLNVTAKRFVRLEARLLNVFNRETTLVTDQRLYLDPRNLTIVGTPPAGCWSCYTDAFQQGTLQTNTRFGQAVSYAQPRRLLLSVSFDF